jgi:hypothetical protein
MTQQLVSEAGQKKEESALGRSRWTDSQNQRSFFISSFPGFMS